MRSDFFGYAVHGTHQGELLRKLQAISDMCEPNPASSVSHVAQGAPDRSSGMTMLTGPDGIRFAQLSSLKGRLSLEVQGLTFKRGVGTTLQRYNELFGTSFAKKALALNDAQARIELILGQSQEDDCYDSEGNALPEGRCDQCGKPVMHGKCSLFPDHEIAKAGD